ncbi:S9 family peptidase [Streptomyces mirabilis]|uniref:S9 family peptidase n=1 Tax=Streptomyces mirabilis TaxID=68239 RepID=UPI002F9137AC
MTGGPITADAYRTAERLLRHHRADLVRRMKVVPHWFDGGARFWYAVADGAGPRFVLVDPERGVRTPAFDHERLAAALTEAAGEPVDPAALPFAAIEPVPGGVSFTAFGATWRWEEATGRCERGPAPAARDPLAVRAPDGAREVFLHGHDLHVRSSRGTERPLTSDGMPGLDYGANPDYFMYSVLLGKLGLPHLPPALLWAPDSRRLLTHRTDQRGVRETHLVDSLPSDGGPPRLLTRRYALPGDERVPLAEFVILDVESGKAVQARSAPEPMSMASPITRGWAWWSADGTGVHYLSASRDGRELRLRRMDAATGEVRTIVHERGATRVEPAHGPMQEPLVRVLSGGEVLWYSQRDGWGHLYRHASDGTLLGRTTKGPWAVRRILHVDESAAMVYFVASGMVAGDPYRRSVCRVALDGTGFALVMDDDEDHEVTVSPDGGHFVDSSSTNANPPVHTVRDWDGRCLVELERADASRLLATGWRPPERFTTTAADGETTVHGMLYLPHDFDPAARYPVLDHPYGFPTGNRVTASFDAGYYGYDAEAMAALGFVVVAVDGRGSAGRDKAFHDVSYGNVADCGLSDHVAALRQLAGTRPWMDTARVGVFGMSAGGYAAVRAMADHPEVFTVGVAEDGMHDLRCLEAGLGETYQGPYDSDAYAAASTVESAHRIEGKLLLVHGGLDDSVLPHGTMRLVERLIAADKDFELLVVPGADHSYAGYDHYVTRRRWDFLVRHLTGCEPPGHRLTPVPLDPASVAGLFG